MQTKALLIVAASWCALTSSTQCFAEGTSDTKPVAKKPVIGKPLKVKVDLSSPEATVRTFVAAINAADVDAIIACVYGAKPLVGKDGAAFRAMVAKDVVHGQNPSLTIGEVKIIIDVKPIRFETVCRFFNGGEMVVAPSVLKMTRADNGWKIIPLSEAKQREEMDRLRAMETQNQSSQLEFDILLLTASKIAQGTQDTHTSVENEMRLVCMRNLRLTASAAMQFAQEWDEKLDFDASNFREKLSPYVSDPKWFLDPKTNTPFALNTQMANCDLGKIQAPSQTVLFYTGANGVLDFNYYNGTAVVAFADGHVMPVSRARAAKLRWNP